MESYCKLCRKLIQGVSAYKTADGELCSECGRKYLATTKKTLISLKNKKTEEIASELHNAYLKEKHSECIVCKTKLLPDNSHIFYDGGICNKCLNYFIETYDYIASDAYKLSAKKIKPDLEKAKQEYVNFLNSTERVLSNDLNDCFRIDKKEKKWKLIGGNNLKVLSFDSLESYSVFDGMQTATSTGNVSGAVIGGLLAGETGAIIGASKKKNILIQEMYIELKLKDKIKRTKISFLKNKVEVGSDAHKKVIRTISEICNYLDYILSENKKVKEEEERRRTEREKQNQFEAQSQFSVADEILKFKKLLDIGAITQEEYDENKIKLLAKL